MPPNICMKRPGRPVRQTSVAADQLADNLVTLLWQGQTDELMERLTQMSRQAGEPLEADPQNHPRKGAGEQARATSRNTSEHTDYPTYRAKGWPIGSGITESGVKRFGKRVKGSEQFWNVSGVEAILALQSKWLSDDEQSTYYWLGRPAKARAA